MRNTRSSYALPSLTQLTWVCSSSRTAQPPPWIQTCEFHTPIKCIFSERLQEWIKFSCKNCCHGQGIVPLRYLQPYDQFNQQHRGGHVDSPPVQLRSVYSPRAPWAQRHRQEDDLKSSGTDRDRILCCQRTSWVLQHHRNFVHAIPSHEYCMCDYSQDRQVRVGN